MHLEPGLVQRKHAVILVCCCYCKQATEAKTKYKTKNRSQRQKNTSNTLIDWRIGFGMKRGSILKNTVYLKQHSIIGLTKFFCWI